MSRDTSAVSVFTATKLVADHTLPFLSPVIGDRSHDRSLPIPKSAVFTDALPFGVRLAQSPTPTAGATLTSRPKDVKHLAHTSKFLCPAVAVKSREKTEL